MTDDARLHEVEPLSRRSENSAGPTGTSGPSDRDASVPQILPSLVDPALRRVRMGLVVGQRRGSTLGVLRHRWGCRKPDCGATFRCFDLWDGFWDSEAWSGASGLRTSRVVPEMERLRGAPVLPWRAQGAGPVHHRPFPLHAWVDFTCARNDSGPDPGRACQLSAFGQGSRARSHDPEGGRCNPANWLWSITLRVRRRGGVVEPISSSKARGA
jgi:hypothetical protein